MSSEASSKSALDALYEKYDDTREEDTDNFLVIFVPTKAAGRLASGGLHLPPTIGLDSYGITHGGDGSRLSAACANVKELDLSDNRINNWNEVFVILDAIPTLDLINLSRNPLTQLTTAETGKSYPLLKRLALNFTKLTWETIANLLIIAPNLEELYLSGNSYERVMLDIPAYDSLRLLQLIDNRLSGWTDVIKLNGLFPKLNHLILAENNISSCGDAVENASIFTSLSVLNMNSTAISEWNELEKLSAIKSLTAIRLASIPLVEAITDRQTRIQLLSVHFPRLKKINSTPIADLEVAERVYMRHFEECDVRPNKYAELEAKHGKLQPLAKVDMKPPFSVSLLVICGDKQEVLDVPTKQTVGQLKRGLKSFVGTSKFRLTLDKNTGKLDTELNGFTDRSLEELYLSGNSYDGVMLDIPAHDSLRLLQLTDNRLSDWTHVLKLNGLFPKLKNLILAHNKISSCGSVGGASLAGGASILPDKSTLVSPLIACGPVLAPTVAA